MRGTLVVLVALLNTYGVAQAQVERDLLERMHDARHLFDLGRQLEGRLMMDTVLAHVADLPDRTRPWLGERAARAVEAMGDPAAAAEARRAASRGGPPIGPDNWGDVLRKIAHDRSVPDELRRAVNDDAVRFLTGLAAPSAAQLRQRAALFIDLGRLADARRDLDAALAAEPAHTGARYTQARLAYIERDYPAVLAAMRGLPASADDTRPVQLLESTWGKLSRHEDRTEALHIAQGWVASGLAERLSPPIAHAVAEQLEVEGKPATAAPLWASLAAHDADGAAAAAARYEGRGEVANAFRIISRVAEARSDAATFESVARLGRQMWTQPGADRAAILARLRTLTPLTAGTPPALLKTTGELLVESGEPLAALAYFKAGLHSTTPADFQRPLAGARDRFKQQLVAQARPGQEPVLDNPDDEATLQERSAELASAIIASRDSGESLELALRSAVALNPMLDAVVQGSPLAPQGVDHSAVKLTDVAPTIHYHGGQRGMVFQAFLGGDMNYARNQLGMALGFMRPDIAKHDPDGSFTGLLEAPLPTPSRDPAERLVRRAMAALSESKASPEVKLARLLETATVTKPSPILIDFGGAGAPELTSETSPEGSVGFDLAGNGRKQQIQWVAGGRQGWLCEDVNHDGRITSGLELFGTAGGYVNGWEKLALRDRDHDGVVCGAELEGLSVWVDRNGDGVTDPGELVSAAAAGVEAISLPHGSLASTIRVRGVTRACWDVWPRVFRLAL